MITNVLQYIENAKESNPQKVVFGDIGEEITYEQLWEYTKAMGTALIKRVKFQKKPIVILMDKSIACLVSFFGIVASGNFYVCIDSHMAKERVKAIINSLQPVALISRKEDSVSVETDIPVFMYDELISELADDSILKCVREEMIDVDIVYALFTSGSTGVPKGSVITHRNIISYIESVTETFGFSEDTVFGSQTPFYFSMSVLDIYSTIRNGASLQIIPKKYFSFPVRLIEYVNSKRINTIYWVPSALSIVANWKTFEYIRPNDIHTVLFAGEVMPTKQFNYWKRSIPDAIYANLFGPTEITDIGAYYIVDREFEDTEPIPIGKHSKNMSIFAINDKGDVVTEGEMGELYFRGAFVGSGYYGDWKKTSEVFVQNPLNDMYPEIVYKTGDLVKLNEYGEFIYQGRKDFQIKHMGYRIELGEIETASNAHPDVMNCVCLFDQAKDEIILIYQGDVSEENIKIHLAEYLPLYMLPARMIRLSQLPINANGKIDRQALKSKYVEDN